VYDTPDLVIVIAVQAGPVTVGVNVRVDGAKPIRMVDPSGSNEVCVTVS
jgi:hypothetical protein